MASKEDYLVTGRVGNLKTTPKKEADIRNQLFSNFSPEKVVDEYEKVLGIKKEIVKPREFKVKNTILCLDKPSDQELFNDLFNNPKFELIYHKDNWDKVGFYKMFIVYKEYADVVVKKDEEPKE